MSNPVISNRIGFPLDLPFFFQSFTMGYLKLGYLEHPAISTRFSLSLAQIDPGYRQTLLRSEEILVNIILEVRQSTSWQDVLKADKCIEVFMVTKAKSNWLDLPLVNFKDQTITPEIWRQPRYLEPPLSRTIFRYPWEFEIAGFYCSSINSYLRLTLECSSFSFI